jgi:hypothetical protein
MYIFLPSVEYTIFEGVSLNGLGVEGRERLCEGVGGYFMISAKPSEMSSLRMVPLGLQVKIVIPSCTEFARSYLGDELENESG